MSVTPARPAGGRVTCPVSFSLGALSTFGATSIILSSFYYGMRNGKCAIKSFINLLFRNPCLTAGRRIPKSAFDYAAMSTMSKIRARLFASSCSVWKCMSSMALAGHSATQLPHPLHLATSISASPFALITGTL